MKPSSPLPKWLERLLIAICDPYLLEGILGDLQEIYEERLQTDGFLKAKWSSIFNAIGFLRPFAWKKIKISFINPTDMFKNYFKLAFRSLIKHRAISFINVLGFTVSITSCLLIALFLHDELSFDGFHEHKDRIYRMAMDVRQENGNTTQTAFSPAPWAPVITASFPEIEASARFMRYRLPVSIHHDKTQKQFYERDFIWADSSVFSVFSFPLIVGNPKTALTQPNTIVISESAARKYFGSQNPIGEVISYEGRQDLRITGVFKDIPTNSHIKADFFASFSTLSKFWDIIDNWRILYYYSYFLLEEESNIATVANKMPTFIDEHLGEKGTQRFSPKWQALSDIYLTSKRDNELEVGGNGDLVYLFATIALLIFLIASANYINLTTAGAVKRAKEIGVRKILGSRQRQLVFQFLGESVLLTSIAIFFAILITQKLLPFFNNFTGKQLQLLGNANSYQLLLILLGSGILFGILAGLYPAFYLAKLKPISSLKKGFNSTSLKLGFRQFLVLFQFATCAALIAGTLVINAQFQFMTDKDLGYAKEQTLLFRLNGEYLNQRENIQTFKKQLLAEPGVQIASIASHRIVGDQPYYGSYRFSGIPEMTENIGMGRLHIDEDFINTFDIKLLAGRSFEHNRVADTSAFIINQAALRRLGLDKAEQALGKLVSYQTRGANGTYPKQGPIIGVTDDFHFRSLHFQVEPMVMDIQPARYHFIAVKLAGQNINQHIQNLENQWRRILPEGLFEYSFVDDMLAKQYEFEQKTRTLFSVFSFMGIAIACLGLFGLATFITTQRTKEIGVRKILGATPLQILTMLSKDILQLIIIALLIGLPLAYYLANQWLDNFSYRIDLSLLLFLTTAAIAIFISLLTICSQAITTVLSNPIKALKQD